MDSGLTSLMKAKYGTTKSSRLVFTENDNLYSAFRKLADNIYKNGEWSNEDYLMAVDTMVRNKKGLSVGSDTLSWTPSRGEEPKPLTIEIEAIKEKEKELLGGRMGNFVGYTAKITRFNQDQAVPEIDKEFVLLDPSNKSGTKHNTRYVFSEKGVRYPDKKIPPYDRVYFSVGNQNRAIGYDKLQRDIMKAYEQQAEKLTEQGVKQKDIQFFLQKLCNPSYSGKKSLSAFIKNPYGELTDEFLATLPRDESVRYWQIPPTPEQTKERGYEPFNWRDLTNAPNDINKLNLDESPYVIESEDGKRKNFIYPASIPLYRRHNHVIDFVKGYIEETYDIILQRNYEQDIEKQVRASAWQTKKNINKETMDLMERTPLKNYFGVVELDNDVDLTLFGTFETEMERINEVLPKISVKADLRLRKLGNYRALGMYHPLTNTIAIDFRDYKDHINGVGIQSFIHEYGHFLDYTSNHKALSLQEEFRPIVTRYREKIKTLPKDSHVRNKAAYYGTPTEVWARAFELYVSSNELTSIFMMSKSDYETSEAYVIFDEEMREELSAYFDNYFPDLKRNISLLNERDVTRETGNYLTKENEDMTENVFTKFNEQLEEKTTTESYLERKFNDVYLNLSPQEKKYFQLYHEAEEETLDNYYSDSFGNARNEAAKRLEAFSANFSPEQLNTLNNIYNQQTVTENERFPDTSISEQEESFIESSETLAANPFDYFKLNQPLSSTFISEFNQVLTDTFDLMKEQEEGTFTYLTKDEVTELMNQHLAKMEELFATVTASIDQLKNPTVEEKNSFMRTLVTKCKEELVSLKNQLNNALSVKKEKALFHVKDKTDSLRIVVKNTMNRRILSMNNKLKTLSDKIDKKIVLEEKSKDPEAPKVEKETEESQQVTTQDSRTESISEGVKKEAEKLEETGDLMDSALPETEGEAIIRVQKIEQLSQQLNVKMTQEDKELLVNEPESIQQQLLVQLEEMAKEKEASASEVEPEMEVG